MNDKTAPTPIPTPPPAAPATPTRPDPSQLAGLPDWLYPAGFWVSVVALAIGVLWPELSVVGVACVGIVPVLAALWVAVTAWNRDRRLSVAALAALVGLGLVVVVKGFIK